MITPEKQQIIDDFTRGVEMVESKRWEQAFHELCFFHNGHMCLCGSAVLALGMGIDIHRYESELDGDIGNPTNDLVKEMLERRPILKTWEPQYRDFKSADWLKLCELQNSDTPNVYVSIPYAIVHMNDSLHMTLRQQLEWLKQFAAKGLTAE